MAARLTVCAFVFCAVILAASTAVFAVAIDAFTAPLPPNPDLPGSGQQILFVGTVYDPVNSYVTHTMQDIASQTELPGVIEGDRYVELSYVSGTATAVVLNGLAFNNDVGGKSTLEIQYGRIVDLDADLTIYAGTQLEIDVIDGDMSAGPRPLPCTITVTSRRGTPQEATASVTLDLVATGVYAYPFVSFTGVDFKHVDMIRVFFDASEHSAIDVSIGPLETDGDPVPTSPATWGHIKSLWE